MCGRAALETALIWKVLRGCHHCHHVKKQRELLWQYNLARETRGQQSTRPTRSSVDRYKFPRHVSCAAASARKRNTQEEEKRAEDSRLWEIRNTNKRKRQEVETLLPRPPTQCESPGDKTQRIINNNRDFDWQIQKKKIKLGEFISVFWQLCVYPRVCQTSSCLSEIYVKKRRGKKRFFLSAAD